MATQSLSHSPRQDTRPLSDARDARISTMSECSSCEHACVSARTSRCVHCGVRFCCWCDAVATHWIKFASLACGVKAEYVDPACQTHAREWGAGREVLDIAADPWSKAVEVNS